MGSDGSVRVSAKFGEWVSKSNHPKMKNNGILTDVEMADGLQRLEDRINRQFCGYGGLLGVGGWGGGREVCVQPWNTEGPSRENTPDGYSTKVTIRFEEEYQVPLFVNNYKVPYIKDLKTTPPKDVELTARWEKGKIHFYQGEPPAYNPPPPPRGITWEEFKASVRSGTQSLLASALAYTSPGLEGLMGIFD